jgi:hypothetical protein
MISSTTNLKAKARNRKGRFMFELKKVIALFIGSLLLLRTIPFVAKAVRTDVSRLFPVYRNGGHPDLTVDPKRFVSQMQIVDRLFDASSCELAEGSIGGTGYRRLLRFDTVLINGGNGDLVVGSPTDPNNPYHSVFVYSPCHDHYHIKGFANYQLLKTNRTIAAQGHKQAFCLEDLLKYTNDNKSSGYTCASKALRLAGRIGITNSSAASGLTSPEYGKAIILCTSKSMLRTPSLKARIDILM